MRLNDKKVKAVVKTTKERQSAGRKKEVPPAQSV